MIAPEGWPFVLTPACFGTALIVLGAPVPGWILITLAGVALIAFRAPVRDCRSSEEVVCAPADGRIRGTRPAPRELRDRGLGVCLSIDPSAVDTLVTRAPLSGRRAGTVHQVTVWEGRSGTVGLHHLPPGRPDPTEDGVPAQRGERVGLRRFRSGIEIYLPDTADLLVRAGDRVRAGATPVATLRRLP